MSIAFTLTVLGVRTAPVEGDLANVVKIVEWELLGEQAGRKFGMQSYCELPAPDPASFIDFEALTPEEMATWVEASGEPYEQAKAAITGHLAEEQEADSAIHRAAGGVGVATPEVPGLEHHVIQPTT